MRTTGNSNRFSMLDWTAWSIRGASAAEVKHLVHTEKLHALSLGENTPPPAGSRAMLLGFRDVSQSMGIRLPIPPLQHVER